MTHAIEFLTVAEVAEELNVSQKQVRTLIANGTLPAQRTDGGRLHVERLMLERWIGRDVDDLRCLNPA